MNELNSVNKLLIATGENTNLYDKKDLLEKREVLFALKTLCYISSK